MYKYTILFLCLLPLAYTAPLTVDWDDLGAGNGLHISYPHSTATFRETRRGDEDFYQKILGNPEVVSTMASGKVNDPREISRWYNGWVERFSEGRPEGFFVVEREGAPIGCCALLPYSTTLPGVGEIVRALLPEVQGRGLGKTCLHFLVEVLAPFVRSRGLAEDMHPAHPSVGKFKCFQGEALSLIYTTARPSNKPSWQGYKHFNFHPSPPTDSAHHIDCEQWEESQQGSLESYIIKRYFSGPEALPYDVRYRMTDEEGVLRTLSFVRAYQSLRYHFERGVAAP